MLSLVVLIAAILGIAICVAFLVNPLNLSNAIPHGHASSIDCTNSHTVYDVRILQQFKLAGFTSVSLVDDRMDIDIVRNATHELVSAFPVSLHPVVVAVSRTRGLVVDTETGSLCDNSVAANLTRIGIESIATKLLDAHTKAGAGSTPPPAWAKAALASRQEASYDGH